MDDTEIREIESWLAKTETYRTYATYRTYMTYIPPKRRTNG